MKSANTFLLFLTISVFCSLPAVAKDVRFLNSQAAATKEALVEKAAKEKLQAEQQAAASKSRILKDRTKLEAAIKELKQEAASLEKEIEEQEKLQARLTREEQDVSEKLAQTDKMINELVGVIRTNAKDVDSLISENHQTALMSNFPDFIAKLSDENSFPGMDEIHQLANSLFDQIEKSGEVSLSMMPIIDRDGKTITGEVLILGPFCAAYRVKTEVGFLRYSAAGRQFYALSKLPAKRMQKRLIQYFEAKSESIPMDITRGAALQQLSHRLSLWEQVEKGGPIVWPILAIFVFGVLIVIERVFFILLKRMNSDRFMGQISDEVQKSNWQKCEDYCARHVKKPLARVLKAGLLSRDLAREEMENVLQEAILREIPPMERYLSTLGMLAAISPLLGLLGTVTGMIGTFHIITLHGTGDPQLMSGGISEALVTTMLGLGAAIPLMLAQTLLNRAIEKEIGTMEEKAIALVNIIHKSRVKACKT